MSNQAASAQLQKARASVSGGEKSEVPKDDEELAAPASASEPGTNGGIEQL